MNLKLLKKLDIVGVFFSFLMACILHFIYEFSGGAVWSIMFGSVNESVWEHIKILTFPFLVWSVIILASAKPYFKQFVASKVIGLYFIGVGEIVFFYTYTFIAGTHILWVDISSTFIFIALGYLISYKIYTSNVCLKKYYHLILAFLFLYLCMFFWFTVSPPNFELFKDPNTLNYGLQG